jgi:hypothetical protein
MVDSFRRERSFDVTALAQSVPPYESDQRDRV